MNVFASIDKGQGASLRDRAVVNGAASVSALRASVPSALDIVQREVVSTALKIRDARRAGVPVAVRSYTAALFALLRVRKQLRAVA